MKKYLSGNSTKPTYMLFEEIMDTFFDENMVCKIDGYKCNSKAGVGIHMKKAHNIYRARGTKRRIKMWHTKEILPSGRDWLNDPLPEQNGK